MNYGNGNNGRNGRNGRNGNGVGNSSEAHTVWNSLQKQTNRLIDKIINFNSLYSREDYVQESFIAVHEACLKYDQYKKIASNNGNGNGNGHKEEIKRISWTFESEEIAISNTIDETIWSLIDEDQDITMVVDKVNMRIDVFAYWFIQKRLYKKADMDEVTFNVTGPDGQYRKTLSNTEYRKNKKALEEEGCTITSSNVYRDLDYSPNGDNENETVDYADPFLKGFPEAVQEMMSEDLKKITGLKIK